MKFWVAVIFCLFLFSDTAVKLFPGSVLESGALADTSAADDTRILYDTLSLEGKMAYRVFERAMQGYRLVDGGSSPLLTIIDYSQPSTAERLFVIDLKSRKLIHNTYVAHGKNSGTDLARSFSNIKSSLKSSPGFYMTGETYRGKHGYSLRLDGLEPGINDRARERAIVIHGADYVSPDFIRRHQRLGRSWGCPAVPDELATEIIDTIKGGTCLYIHTDDPGYLGRSAIVGQ